MTNTSTQSPNLSTPRKAGPRMANQSSEPLTLKGPLSWAELKGKELLSTRWLIDSATGQPTSTPPADGANLVSAVLFEGGAVVLGAGEHNSLDLGGCGYSLGFSTTYKAPDLDAAQCSRSCTEYGSSYSFEFARVCVCGGTRAAQQLPKGFSV